MELSKKIDHPDSQEESRNLYPVELEERIQWKDELDMLLQQEETLWRQRARVQWLNDGDQNTKFFHTWASNKHRKNLIFELHYKGERLTDNRQVHQTFRDYYKGLLGASPNLSVKADWQTLYPGEQLPLQDLERPFMVDEVKKAVFSLASQKSPGPNGFSFEFYK